MIETIRDDVRSEAETGDEGQGPIMIPGKAFTMKKVVFVAWVVTGGF